MATFNLKLEPGLSPAMAVRLALKEIEGEITSWKYNEKNGRMRVETRAFPIIPPLDPESEFSKEFEKAIEEMRTNNSEHAGRMQELDKRERQLDRRERKLDERDKKLDEQRDQLKGERKELRRRERELMKGKFNVVGRVKSFFHRGAS